MAELADAGDLKSSGRDTLWVQFPPAPYKAPIGAFFVLYPVCGGIRKGTAWHHRLLKHRGLHSGCVVRKTELERATPEI